MTDKQYLRQNTFIIQIPEKVIGKTRKLVNSLTSKGAIANDSIIIKTSNTDNHIKILNEGIYESLDIKKTSKKEPKKEPKKELKKEPKKEPKKLSPTRAANLIQTKLKGFMYPFINRVSANIYDREVYYYKLLKKLKIDIANKNNCLKFYKIVDGKPEFTISDLIHIKNQIGTESKFGIVYIGSFKDNENKIFKYAIKIAILKQSEKEIEYLEKLKKALLKHQSPHFPLLYSTLYCNDMRVETKTIEPSILATYPKLLLKIIKKKTPIVILLNELANGDLKTFIHQHYENKDLIGNAFVQVQLSLFSFYLTTGALHMDSHWGNFLFHKIKSGGYFHYKICNVDYYLKNLGFLWVIWDFGLSKDFSVKPAIMTYDSETIIRAFLNKKNNGWLDNKFKINKDISINILEIWNHYFNINKNIYNRLYTPEGMNLYILSLLNDMNKNGWITRIKPDKNEIINDKPYEIRFKDKY